MSKKSLVILVVSLAVVSLIAAKFFFARRGGLDAASKTAPVRKVILIGVDGADWDIARPLIAAGRLPNFARLVSEGATGPLRTIEPMLSPLIWTTMATGKMPEEHGILSFTVFDPRLKKKVPITREYRKVDAVWNMLSRYGRTVDVVGWLATYPAEEINGVMVTDKVGYLAFASPERGEDVSGRISPEERRAEIESLMLRGEDVTYGEFQRFLHINRGEFEKNRDIPFDPKNRVNNMILLYASTKSVGRIGLHLLQEDEPDLLAVYFEFVDATGHLFMPFAPPRRSEVSEDDYARYKDAVEEAYVYQDSLVGEFMKRCGEGTVLMVVSDHGFKSGGARLRGGAEVWGGRAAMWHRPYGVVCFYGDGVKKGYKIDGASVIDVAPTLLALAGLPKAQDMPGGVLADAFERSVVDRFDTETVATLDSGKGRQATGTSGEDRLAEEEMKKLEALGYITGDNPDAHNNLGQRYQKNGEYEKAIAEYEKAIRMNPNFSGAINNLGICYGKLKRFREAEETFRKALAINPSDAYAMNNMAVMFMERGDLEQAKSFAEKAVAVEPNYANAHMTLGVIYANLHEYERAAASFRRALEIDPLNKGAKRNLDKLKTFLSGGERR
jgi:predicted AlkP superfamily phosphohydrolase/phosphomutase